ncbi:MAG: NTPase [Nitrososphaerota archaeon]|nr:NTPase [Nitrososphaerota archaeon]
MSKTRIWLLTGEPGAGKSTALSRIMLSVRSKGFTVGGMLTREIRKHGEREGFLLVNVATDESRLLASVSGITGPRIGKYRIDLNCLSVVAVSALEHARISSDIVVCDEIGPMELLSRDFREEVRLAILESYKPCVCVVHKSYSDPLIDDLKKSTDAREIELTLENRDSVTEEVQKDIIQVISSVAKGKK